MANNYIYKVKLPSGNEYLIKDLQARQQIASITGQTALGFKGVTTTNLTDGATTTTLSINGSNVTFTSADVGSIVIYKPTNTNQPPREFIWDGSNWQLFGSASGILGDLAYASTASASYTPAGSITLTTGNKTPTISSATAASNNHTFSTLGSVSLSNQDKTAIISTEAITSTKPSNFTPAGTITITTGNKTATVSTGSGNITYTPAGAITVSLDTVPQQTTAVNQVTGVSDTIRTLTTTNAGGTVASNNTDLIYCGVEIPSGSEDGVLVLNHVTYTSGKPVSSGPVTVTTQSATYSVNATNTKFEGTGVRLVTGNIEVPTSLGFNGTPARLINSAISVPTAVTPTTQYIKLTSNAIEVPTAATFNGTPATITVSPVTS